MSALNVQAERIVWVVILEMVVALALAAFIIWFTWPKKKPPGDK